MVCKQLVAFCGDARVCFVPVRYFEVSIWSVSSDPVAGGWVLCTVSANVHIGTGLVLLRCMRTRRCGVDACAVVAFRRFRFLPYSV